MKESWELPKTISIAGKDYIIRSDFRAVLDILIAQNDPELEDWEKLEVMFQIMYVDWQKIPESQKEEALRKAVDFIDMGMGGEEKSPARVMDWEQDAPILIPSINQTLGYEVRNTDYLHWWTFMGGYMTMQEGVATTVISIRQKQAKGKKLEKWEREFIRENKSIYKLRTKLTEEEIAEKERLNKLLGGG